MPTSHSATILSSLRRIVSVSDIAVRRDRSAGAIAVGAGAILIVAGLAKFVAHGSELAAFRRFGLPAPDVAVIAIGLLETAGGALLALRRLVAPAAVVMIAIMMGAICVSGIGHGDVLPSLTLAPALLVSLAYMLMRVGARSGAKRTEGG